MVLQAEGHIREQALLSPFPSRFFGLSGTLYKPDLGAKESKQYGQRLPERSQRTESGDCRLRETPAPDRVSWGQYRIFPSFCRLSAIYFEFLRLSTGIFLRFCCLQAQLPQNLQIISPNFCASAFILSFCRSEDPVLQNLRKNPPNYQEFLSPSRFNRRFCWFSPAKSPNKSKSSVKISEKNQLFWISMLMSLPKSPLCPPQNFLRPPVLKPSPARNPAQLRGTLF